VTDAADILREVRALDARCEVLWNQHAETRSAHKRERLLRGLEKRYAERAERRAEFLEALPYRDPDLLARSAAAVRELERIAARSGPLTDREASDASELLGQLHDLDDELLAAATREAGLERRRDRVRAALRSGRGVSRGDGGNDQDDHDHTTGGRGRQRGATMRTSTSDRAYDQAARNIDQAARSGILPDYAADRADRLLTEGSTHARGFAARWAASAGDPAYLSAFGKILADEQRGHLLWTEQERAAWQAVAEVQAEQRAMGTTPASAGGAMIPLTLDPAIILTSDGSANPLRQISRVVQTTTNAWQGVTSAGTSAEWKAEHAEVADASFPMAPAPIPVHFGDAFVPFSFEVGQDAAAFASELSRVLADAADQLQAEAYVTGDGNGRPRGVVTGATTTVETSGPVGPAAIVATQNALGPRFQDRARWAGNLALWNELESLETSNGSLRFPSLQADEPRLLRKPVHEVSHMTGDLETNAGAVALYGDFEAGFVIVDRIGSTLELVPHLFGENGRPTGQRGALLWFRTGSDVVAPNAFRKLVKTAS
jgi:HK97 family phage major capsid protein